jgi:hypothetical protein
LKKTILTFGLISGVLSSVIMCGTIQVSSPRAVSLQVAENPVLGKDRLAGIALQRIAKLAESLLLQSGMLIAWRGLRDKKQTEEKNS